MGSVVVVGAVVDELVDELVEVDVPVVVGVVVLVGFGLVTLRSAFFRPLLFGLI